MPFLLVNPERWGEQERTKMNEIERLPKKQQSAIVALISHRTIEEASQSAGIGRTIIFKWLQNEDFQAAYRQARADVVRHAIAQAQNACSEAVTVLREIMNSTESPASTRVSAAKAILETSLKAVELEDIISRIEKLEEKIQDRR